MMTIRQALDKSVALMKSSQIESPKMKSRLLMQYVLKCTRQHLIVYDNKQISKEQEKTFFEYVAKMKRGTPLQHITHTQEFMKLSFFVNEDVLIPRHDTECLVEEVIAISKKLNALTFLDLCTGSGAIAVSLAKYIPNSKVTAIDISSKALKIAKRNAKSNEVEKQITFLQSDLFEKLSNERFDVIVSNPPYVKRDVMKKLDKTVKEEPSIALDGGYDGLDFYRRIIPDAYQFLRSKGYLCMEIGYDQKEDVMDLIKKQDKFMNIYCKKDLFDKDRVVCAKLL